MDLWARTPKSFFWHPRNLMAYSEGGTRPLYMGDLIEVVWGFKVASRRRTNRTRSWRSNLKYVFAGRTAVPKSCDSLFILRSGLGMDQIAGPQKNGWLHEYKELPKSASDMLTYVDPWGRPVLTQATTRKTGHPGAEDFVTFGAEDGHFHCCTIWLLQSDARIISQAVASSLEAHQDDGRINNPSGKKHRLWLNRSF